MSDSDKAQPTADEIAQARAQVESRIAEENATPPQAVEDPITHDFVKKCLRASQKGDGLLFAAMHRDRFVCVPELKNQWYEWTGAFWKPVYLHRVEAAVEAVVLRYDESRVHYDKKRKECDESGDKDEAKRLANLCKKLRERIDYLRKGEGVSACLRFALSNDDPLTATVSQFDADPWLFGVGNGVVELRTGEFRQARPEDMIHRTTAVEWKGIDAECPTWEAFVQEIVGDDPEKAAFLQRVFGYAITGQSCEPLFVVLSGEGRNGKTVMMKLLGKVCGSYMAPVPAELLLDQGQVRDMDKPTSTLMSLRGMRIAHAAETDDNRKFSVSRVKWLSGDDQIVGRYPWDRDNVFFDPTHTLFLLTNHKPHAGAHEYAFWDRLRLVLFPYRYVDIPKEENERPRDRTLPAKLEKELSGIMAWLVRGCLLYQRDGISPPKSVLNDSEEYKREEDHMQDFIDECLIRIDGTGMSDQERRTNSTDIYDLYTRWYLKNKGKYIPVQQTFGKHLGKKIHKEKRGGNIYYYDVHINQDALDRYPEPEAKGRRRDRESLM